MQSGAQTILITGASGRLGRRAAELVLEAHPAERLILISRTPEAISRFTAVGVDVRYGDFSDASSLTSAFADSDRVLLVSTSDLEHRVEQHSAAIDAAVAAGARHVIYTSGLSPEPPNPAVVAPSHYATEQHLAAAGVTWTVLRNSLYAEFQASEADRAIETGKLVHNRGDGKVAYVSREDCAAAAAAVLVDGGHANAVYDITGPSAWGATDLAKLYGVLGGANVEPVPLDDRDFVASIIGDSTEDDHLKYGAELVASFGRSIREGYMASCTHCVEELTGRPARSLGDVLRTERA